MWFISYTQQWFDNLISVASVGPHKIDETYFVFILMHELNTELQEYLENYYSSLDKASGSALQILAPIKPPRTMLEYPSSWNPDFPLADSTEERQAFFHSVREAGLNPSRLPQIVFFQVSKVEDQDNDRYDKYELTNIKAMSLRAIEFGGSEFTSYREFFSELVAIAQDARVQGHTHDQFYSRVFRRFRAELFEEEVRQVPVIGTLYQKYVGS